MLSNSDWPGWPVPLRKLQLGEAGNNGLGYAMVCSAVPGGRVEAERLREAQGRYANGTGGRDDMPQKAAECHGCCGAHLLCVRH